MRLDEAFARREDMAILMELQCVLRSMCQSIERRRAHVLGSKVVLMLHWWRKLLVLVEARRHHPSSAGLGHNCTARQQRVGLNGGGGETSPGEIRFEGTRQTVGDTRSRYAQRRAGRDVVRTDAAGQK